MGDTNLYDVLKGVLEEVGVNSVPCPNKEAVSSEFKQWLESKGFIKPGNIVYEYMN